MFVFLCSRSDDDVYTRSKLVARR